MGNLSKCISSSNIDLSSTKDGNLGKLLKRVHETDIDGLEDARRLGRSSGTYSLEAGPGGPVPPRAGRLKATVLGKLPKSVQPAAKQLIHEMY